MQIPPDIPINVESPNLEGVETEAEVTNTGPTLEKLVPLRGSNCANFKIHLKLQKLRIYYSFICICLSGNPKQGRHFEPKTTFESNLVSIHIHVSTMAIFLVLKPLLLIGYLP